MKADLNISLHAESPIRGVCNTWPCGTPRSNNNAFSGALLEDRPAAVLRATPGRKPKGIATGINATSSLTRGRTTRECRPSDCARTTRILKGGI